MNQKKVKFNVVDIIVILLLIAGAVFVGIRMFGGQEPAPAVSDPTSELYHVTFHADCIPQAVADSLVQDSWADCVPQTQDSSAEKTSESISLGKLSSFTTGPSVIYGFDSKGKCVASEKPGFVSVTLVCELTGIQQPTGLQVGEYMLNIGHSMGVRCGNTEITAIVHSIAPANAG